jgi:hypothetical protein
LADVLQDASNVQQEGAKNNFAIKFAMAAKIEKIIKEPDNTEAVGMDGIQTSVLKKGVEVIAGPISHLLNRSLAKGRVPAAFKVGIVHPIHKEKRKPQEDPVSYRPVFILPAKSKILETLVKSSLEDHLAAVNGS